MIDFLINQTWKWISFYPRFIIPLDKMIFSNSFIMKFIIREFIWGYRVLFYRSISTNWWKQISNERKHASILCKTYYSIITKKHFEQNNQNSFSCLSSLICTCEYTYIMNICIPIHYYVLCNFVGHTILYPILAFSIELT